MAVRAVLSQQIMIKAARTLASRIATACGNTIDTGIAGFTHIFLSAVEIAVLEEAIADPLAVLWITKARRTGYEYWRQGMREGISISIRRLP